MAWQPAPITVGKHSEIGETALQHPKNHLEAQPELTLPNSTFDQTPNCRSFARGSNFIAFMDRETSV